MSKPKIVIDWIDKNIVKKVIPFYRFLWFVLQIILWVALTFFLTPILAGLFNSIFHKDVSLSDFILLITAAFIIFYTFETQKMRKQMEKSKEAEFMPVVIFDPSSDNDFYFDINTADFKNHLFVSYLANVGRGIAKELVIFINGCRISSHTSIQPDNEAHQYIFYFKDLPEEIIKLLRSVPTQIKMRLEYKDIYENEFCTECSLEKFEKSHSNGYKISSKWNFFQL